jgi:protein-tyrosine phosphatase
VTTDDLERAGRVVALKRDEHLPLLQERFPAWAEKLESRHCKDP